MPTLTREQIKKAALELDPHDREVLAEEILSSISLEESEEIRLAWLAEARERSAAFKRGETGAKPMSEVLDRLYRKARK